MDEYIVLLKDGRKILVNADEVEWDEISGRLNKTKFMTNKNVVALFVTDEIIGWYLTANGGQKYED